ncbi:hypothetical protein RclHR1_13830006 [Rhizophagus clarus]|uniref:Uncharacterized protein n=1 Tax=Rhizophagus clarus TaxID=94130 RepID=A0A2Z6QNJ7_9GLOM|nr:hypothetical protein RclHR1_13830006 [Rhizophagus clarus]
MNEYLSIIKKFKDKENKENGLSFERTLNIVMLNNNSPKNIAEGIIEQISDADNFHWNSNRAKKAQKCFDLKKQRDTPFMKRFDCCGEINIVINLEIKTASVKVIHKILHELPKEVGVSNSSKLGKTRFKRDLNAFLSAKALLEEYNCTKILDIDLPVQAVAFETGLYQIIIENNISIKECGINATFKQKGEVDLNFFDVVTRNNSYPFIFESNKLTKSSGQTWEMNSLENDTNNEYGECEDLYNHLITITDNTLQILKEQKATGNLKWAKNIKKNFYSINKMQEEIKSYQRSQKIPLT